MCKTRKKIITSSRKTVAVITIASTHCAYPRRDGQAELALVAGYAARWFTRARIPSPIPLLTGLNVEQLR